MVNRRYLVSVYVCADSNCKESVSEEERRDEAEEIIQANETNMELDHVLWVDVYADYSVKVGHYLWDEDKQAVYKAEEI